IFRDGVSKQKVGTKEFAEAVVARMGKLPETLRPASYAQGSGIVAGRSVAERPQVKKGLVGVDVFLHWNDRDPNKLGAALKKLDGDGLQLSVISNRGEKVWPGGMQETFCTDHWRCRYLAPEKGGAVTHQQILNLLGRVAGAGFDFIKTENLNTFDGQPAYSQSQDS
ncbi:MAG TPA: hypothetical protein VMT34_14055, partial [Aggregatilineales bacterium]|nr:hypothetical protein [Aggregatilineales bacterium]